MHATAEDTATQVPRLSRPASELKASYDILVIGSGYGGGVAASRLARCGRKVAVLERGREYLPGDFPSGPIEATKALQMSGATTAMGARDALFDLRLGEGIHVLQGCGLGGTSLINANVCLTPDERVFSSAAWPHQVGSDRVLAEGYVRARAMLRPSPQPGWQGFAKVRALDAAASVMNKHLKGVPIHVAFSSGPNAAKVPQPSCIACGDCCGGCNVGAKTTVANTYLADAVAHGAEIFTGTRVHSIRKTTDGKWRVVVESGDADSRAVSRHISATFVVLAAGTLNSTEILMRSAAEGLAVSDQLGQHFTSNGDAIALSYNNVMPVNGIGRGHPAKAQLPPVGAAVNGLIDLRDTDDVRDGLAIVECALPSSLAALLPVLLGTNAAIFGKDGDKRIVSELAEFARSAQSLFGGAYTGAIHNTQTFLAVGHDGGEGRMRIEGERIVVSWPNASRQAVFARIEEVLKIAAHATGGTYLRNPASENLLGGNLMTVHPLGGCVMADNRAHGVVNHKGQVFDTSSSDPDAVHDGLYVCDGSVIPCSLGVHPLLTITALAERTMMHLAHDRKWNMREGPTPDWLPPASKTSAATDNSPRRKGFLGWLSG